MTHQEALSRLDQRRRWLTERIKAKRTIGWDVEYDISERDALARILEHLRYDQACDHSWISLQQHDSKAYESMCSYCGIKRSIPFESVCDPCYDEEKTT